MNARGKNLFLLIVIFLLPHKIYAQGFISYGVYPKNFEKYNVTYSYGYLIFYTTDSTYIKPLQKINERIKTEVDKILTPNIRKANKLKGNVQDHNTYTRIAFEYHVPNADDRFISVQISTTYELSDQGPGNAVHLSLNFLTSTGEEVTDKIFKPDCNNKKLTQLITSKISTDCKPDKTDLNFKKDFSYVIDKKNIGVYAHEYLYRDNNCLSDNYYTLARNEYQSFTSTNEIVALINKDGQNLTNGFSHSWIEVKKAYLFNEPDKATITKLYLIQDDPVTIIEKRGPWAKVVYFSPTANKVFTNWVELNMIYGKGSTTW